MRLPYGLIVFTMLLSVTYSSSVDAQFSAPNQSQTQQQKRFAVTPIPDAQRKHRHPRPALPAYDGRSTDYQPLWQCVCESLKPVNISSLKSTKPSKPALAEALLESVDAGDDVCVRSLLNGGADVEASAGNPARLQGPPLKLALSNKKWQVASTLVDRSAKLNWPTDNLNALQLAELNGAPRDLIAKIIMRNRRSHKR
jgi:hypothetical protein